MNGKIAQNSMKYEQKLHIHVDNRVGAVPAEFYRSITTQAND